MSKFSRMKAILAALLLALLTSAVGLCNSFALEKKPPVDSPVSAGIERPENITIVDDYSYAPFAFIDAEGKPRGITVDIWRLWSQKTGIPVEIKLMEWESALAAVEEGKADVVGGLFRTPHREDIFDFTQSFYEISTSVFFHRQIVGIRGLNDLHGFLLGVVKGDTAEDYIPAKNPSIRLDVYPGVESIVEAALEGKLKVFVADTYVARFYLAKHGAGGEFLESQDLVTSNPQYAAVRKGNTQLLALLQYGLDQISKDEIRTIVGTWSGNPVFSSISWTAVGMVLVFIAVTLCLMLIWNLQLKRKVAAATSELRNRNEDLLRSELNYKEIFNASSDMIFLHDVEDGRFLDMNQTVVEFCGYTKEELLGKNAGFISADIPPFNEDEALRKIRKTITGGDHVFEWLFRRSNGETFWADVALRNSHIGGENRVLSVVHDITERKLAEEALRTSQRLLRDILDTVPVRVFWKDLDLRYCGCNLPFAKDAGYNSPDEVIGKNDFEMIWQKEADLYRSDDQWIIKSGQTKLGYEEMQTAPDGKCSWLRTSKIPLRDANNSIIGILGTYEDITESKRGEEALRESENRFRNMMEQSPFSMLVFSPQGVILQMNDAGARLWGVKRDKVKGYNILKDQQIQNLGFMPMIQRAFAGERVSIPVMDYDVSASFGQGNRKIVQGDLYPIKAEDGAVRYIILVHQDITERKQAEMERDKLQAQLLQAQKMESVGRLAGGVAHDFNNMLGVIIGHAELALRKINPDQPFYKNLKEIDKAAHRSADLTRQLLAFARKQTVEPKILDLNNAIEGMLKMLRRLIGEDIGLLWKPAANLWPVKMDPVQIDQIMVNLCVNARDAIAGVGKVTIETENIVIDEAYCSDHAGFIPGSFVMLIVSDNGCGMDKDIQEQIFEPFFTTKAVGQGTGLGLAMVYGILKQNHGFINVYSESGNGSTFKIYIPRFEGNSGEFRIAAMAEIQQGGGETILLVEDEPMILELSQTILEIQEYQVLTAGNPHEAIRLAREYAGEIHLLLTDVIMPDMNGRELHQRILKIRPGIKCLFMSGYTANVVAHHGVLDQGIHFLQKPISRDILVQKLREVLSGV